MAGLRRAEAGRRRVITGRVFRDTGWAWAPNCGSVGKRFGLREGDLNQNPTACRITTTWVRPGSSWWISRILPM